MSMMIPDRERGIATPSSADVASRRGSASGPNRVDHGFARALGPQSWTDFMPRRGTVIATQRSPGGAPQTTVSPIRFFEPAQVAEEDQGKGRVGGGGDEEVRRRGSRVARSGRPTAVRQRDPGRRPPAVGRGHSGPGRAQRMPRSVPWATVPASSAPQLPCLDQRWCRRGARRPSAPGISSWYSTAGALRFERARPGLRRSRSPTLFAFPRPLWPGSPAPIPLAIPTRLHRRQRGSSFRLRTSTGARADAVAGNPNGSLGPSPSRRSLGNVGGDEPLAQGQQVLPQLHRLSHHEGEPQVDQEGGCPIQPVRAESEPGLLPS